MASNYIKKKQNVSVKRALISVSDKTEILEFASGLHKHQIEIISTGGTARLLRESGIPVTDVSEITGFPECLNGRVKTLHPKIHGGLLARPGLREHAETLDKLEIKPIQLVVVNLYPFGEAIASRPDDTEHAIENIDIGGPAMVRASAKNFENVCIVTHPEQYVKILGEIDRNNGSISAATRASFAASAFSLTASYDLAISTHLLGEIEKLFEDARDHTHESVQSLNNMQKQVFESESTSDIGPGSELKPEISHTVYLKAPLFQKLRYGENPHQAGAVYGDPGQFIDCFHGKELSYNNYLDMEAALLLGADFIDSTQALCGIFKHSLPCGAALADTPSEAWEKAFSTDTISPFGGIILFNRPVDSETAESVDRIFSEIILAPDFSDDALELLTRKSNRRLIRIRKWPDGSVPQVRSTVGGYLWQHADTGFRRETRKIVTQVKPDREQQANLEFAWIIAKLVKSNAIVYANDMQTVGVGTGQPNRVDSSRIAAQKAERFGHSLKGSVVASDAFFPFADGVEEAARAGASAVIQPGGSIRDDEVIKKADELGIAMIFTGVRHFRH